MIESLKVLKGKYQCNSNKLSQDVTQPDIETGNIIKYSIATGRFLVEMTSACYNLRVIIC